MRTFRGVWSLAGLLAGLAGLATSYFVAMAMSIRETPVVAVAELVIRLTPGWLAEYLIGLVGTLDKPLLVVGVLVLVALVFAVTGRLARERWWAAALTYVILAAIGVIAVLVQRGTTVLDIAPVAVGFVTWLIVLSLLTNPLREEPPEPTRRQVVPPGVARRDVVSGAGAGSVGQTRRGFVARAVLVAASASVLGLVGRVVGRGRRQVEESRRLVRLPQVSEPAVPSGARLGVSGVTPWASANDSFYLIHTAIIVPTIEPKDWSLRIHGAVERELVITYADLLERQFTEAWVTLNCVSNPVGGNLIGNAHWSGVLLKDLIEEAGPLAGADAVLQTSQDGWTCGTPLSAITDGRNAMLAVAMNGSALPIEHGFPVRTIVPGLYGYVSACKWVEDMEVTSFDKVTAYWTARGWGEQGPVKMSSRIDVPRSGEQVSAGKVTFGGVAWAQHTGISAVEFAIDGGSWQPAEIGTSASTDTWVQWRGTASVESGDHLVQVRATDLNGTVQDSVQRDVLPDGATGYHTSDFATA